MKLNKILMLAGALATMLSFSSCSDDDDYTPGAPAEGNQLMAVTFAENNMMKAELDPADPTEVEVTVYRATDDAEVTIPLTMTVNDEGVFSAPESVTFAAGKKEASFKVKFDKAEVGTTYKCEVAVDQAYTNPYLATTRDSYVINITRVKWNSLGMGVWYDGFWYGFAEEIEIFQRDDVPASFRVMSPYTDERAQADGSLVAGYQGWLTFKVGSDGSLNYSDISTNALYQDTGIPVVGYHPSRLGQDGSSSYVEFDENGEIAWFNIDPYWYVNGVGGYGMGYTCYLVFPGHELPAEEEEGGEE